MFGLPSDIVSDRGHQFTSAVRKAFSTSVAATVSLTSGYYPQSNGHPERANQDLETCLRCMVSSNPSTSSTLISWVEYAHNTTSSATGMSPFQCVFGYQPRLVPSQEKELSVPSVQAQPRRCHEDLAPEPLGPAQSFRPLQAPSKPSLHASSWPCSWRQGMALHQEPTFKD